MKARKFFFILPLLLLLACGGGGGYKECPDRVNTTVGYGSVAIEQLNEHNEEFVVYAHHDGEELLYLPQARQETFFGQEMDEEFVVYVLPEAAYSFAQEPEDSPTEESWKLIRRFVPIGARQYMYAIPFRLDSKDAPALFFDPGYIHSPQHFDGSAVYYVGIQHESKCVTVVKEPAYWRIDRDVSGADTRRFYP